MMQWLVIKGEWCLEALWYDIRRYGASFLKFLVGIVSFYVALFAFASNYYEIHLDRFEDKKNSYISLLGTPARANILHHISRLQYYKLPVEPKFWRPSTSVHTFIYKAEEINQTEAHNPKVQDIANLLASFKQYLGCPDNSSPVRVLAKTNCVQLNLSHVKLNGSALKRANFSHTLLLEADMQRAYLEGSNLREAELPMAKLQKADLRKATLVKSNLTKAKLEKALADSADFRGAYLIYADMSYMSLKKANLSDADLNGATLTGADLENADLRGVSSISCEQLQQALNWQTTYRDKTLACGAAIPSI